MSHGFVQLVDVAGNLIFGVESQVPQNNSHPPQQLISFSLRVVLVEDDLIIGHSFVDLVCDFIPVPSGQLTASDHVFIFVPIVQIFPNVEIIDIVILRKVLENIPFDRLRSSDFGDIVDHQCRVRQSALGDKVVLELGPFGQNSSEVVTVKTRIFLSAETERAHVRMKCFASVGPRKGVHQLSEHLFQNECQHLPLRVFLAPGSEQGSNVPGKQIDLLGPGHVPEPDQKRAKEQMLERAHIFDMLGTDFFV